MNRESERERIRTEHERTVGRYACKHGAWEPVESAIERDPAVVADALYLALDAATHNCWKCPCAADCDGTEGHDCASLLCKHWYGRAESLCSGEVPQWSPF